jgi:cytochrome c
MIKNLSKIKTNFKKILKNQEIKLKSLSFFISILVVFISVIFADLLYRPKQNIKRGFEIELSADGKPVVKKEEKIIDLATLLKTADIDRGIKIFKKCATCHSINKGEAAKVGPNLYAVLGRKRGSMSGFSYSKAMIEKGGSWDAESINQFIAKPREYLPGTKMAFAGLKKPQDRADIILYLQKQK